MGSQSFSILVLEEVTLNTVKPKLNGLCRFLGISMWAKDKEWVRGLEAGLILLDQMLHATFLS